MPDTLTARDRYHLKKYGSVDSPVRLAMKNGGSIVEHRDVLLKQFGNGGGFEKMDETGLYKDKYFPQNNELPAIIKKYDLSKGPINYGSKLYSTKENIKYDSQEKQDIANWLYQRKELPTVKNQISGLEYNRQLTNLSTVREVPDKYTYLSNILTIPDVRKIDRNDYENIKKTESIDNSAINDNLISSIKDYNANGNLIRGNYSPKGHVIYPMFSNENNKINELANKVGYQIGMTSSTKKHELTHALNATPQENKISTIIPLKDKYLDSPTEVYSRLMQLRLDNKLDPKKWYSIDDIKEIRDAIKSGYNPNGYKDYRLFDRYDDKQIYNLLNNVAKNNQPQLIDSLNSQLPIT